MTPTPSLLLTVPVYPVSVVEPQAVNKAEFGRLMHAAIISTRFRTHLLTNPMAAIETGYMGESFQFSGEIKSQLRDIHAGTLEEFASKVIKIVEVPSKAEMAVLHF
jgi:hypothetical protein